jgi:hypothetical protein
MLALLILLPVLIFVLIAPSLGIFNFSSVLEGGEGFNFGGKSSKKSSRRPKARFTRTRPSVEE